MRFPGQLSDVRPLLDATDVFCHPSLADGMPNSVVEAMAMGLPVLASNVGGVPEIISDEENGVLTPGHDIERLKTGLLRLAGNAELRERLGAAAAKAVRQKMDLSACSQHWEQVVARESEAFRADCHTVTAPPSAPRALAYPVLFLMTHLRTGGEETELEILAGHLNRLRFPLSVVSAWPVNEPSPVADRLKKLEIPVDMGCHTMATLEQRADYLAGRIEREGIRLLVACQTTTLAYMVLQRLRSTSCKLIEHAGIPPGSSPDS